MPVFSPPPREQVLSGLHVQAEHAHNLVEDLAAGSETASQDLLSLASTVLDRARMYQWPRVASWALALEERLAGWAPGEPAPPADMSWLRRHVGRFDKVLEPTRIPDESAQEAAEGASEDAPTVDSVVNLEALDEDAEEDAEDVDIDLEVDVDEKWFELDKQARESTPPGPPSSDEASVLAGAAQAEAELEAELAGLDLGDEGAEEAVAAPSEDTAASAEEVELDSALEGLAEEEDIDLAGEEDIDLEGLDGLTEEEDVGVAGAASPGEADVEIDGLPEQSPPPVNSAAAEAALAVADEGQTTAAFKPEIVEFMAKELDAEAEGADVPEPGSAPVALDGDASSVEGEPEVRPTLGKLDLQRVAPRRSHDGGGEIAGPEQFVVVSVAADPEVHLWLGKTLPERRFELLTSRGVAEAEIACREHQPDLVLVEWKPDSEIAIQAVRRLRANPVTRYVRIALVAEEASLPSRLAAARLGAVAVLSRTATPKDVVAQVIVAVLSTLDLPDDTMGEASMEELTDLLIGEIRSELSAIQAVVGDVQVPVTGFLGQTLRDTSSKLSEGVELALGGGVAATTADDEEDDEAVAEETIPMQAPYLGKRALLLEADRLRRAALAEELTELGLEVLPPVADLTKALESGLAWAPDIFIGGAPGRDALTCVKILRRDIALSSMLWVIVRWDGELRQWPDPRADAAEQRPLLLGQLTEAFAPMAILERNLKGASDVEGRVESFGMPALLRLLLEARESAFLEVKEGTDRFEGMIGGGQLLDARWIEADGTVTEHFEAFVRLLGVRRGRFAVLPLDEIPEPAVPGALGELLAAACHWWRPLALKVDRRLADIHPLDLNERRTSELKRQSSKPIRKVVKELARGKAPAELLSEGFDQSLVSDAVRELVRRLAVANLPTGEEGEDTVTVT